MLSKTVYAAAVNNLTDARNFSAYGVQYLGFCFNPNDPAYISPEKALEIRDWVSGPDIVADLRGQDMDNAENIISFMAPYAIEIDANMLEAYAHIPVPKFIHAEKIDDQHVFNDVLYIISGSCTGDAHPACMLKGKQHALPQIQNHIEAYYITGGTESEAGIRDLDELNDWLDRLSG
ncbi:MAG: hypothetical protein R2794_07665 [Chitinophagales bacterium]